MNKMYRILKSSRVSGQTVWSPPMVLWVGSNLDDDELEEIYNPRIDKPIRKTTYFDYKTYWEISYDYGKTWEETYPPKELIMMYNFLGMKVRRI